MKIGKNTKIWDKKGLWGDYIIGDNCKIGKFVEIGDKVTIGNNCKIEAFAFIPPGITIGNNVFVGPHVCFTNDKRPAVGDWSANMAKLTYVEDNVSIGANSVILPVTLGKGCLIGAGSVVTKHVPSGETWAGNPARKIKV